MNYMQATTVWLLLDSFGLLVVAAIWSWEAMHDKPKPEETTPQKTLRERVCEMLDHARQNDYDVLDWTIDDIIADLHAFGDVYESAEELRPHVIWWKATRRDLIA